MKQFHWGATLLLVLSVAFGCNQGRGTSDVESARNSDMSNPGGDAAKVLAPSNTGTHSPAYDQALPIGPDAPPEQVVSTFLDALRSGDEKCASALLTDKAARETEKENLVVQPPGTPSATYTVGRAQFVSEKKDGAHVSSLWTETDDQGASQKYEIIWVLRRQQHNGWRIAGMATEVVPGEAPLFLNFEDPKDMLSKWEQANSELTEKSDSSGIRQANNASNPQNEQAVPR